MSQFELVEFVEPAFGEGGSFAGTRERVLGVYDLETAAIESGRAVWNAFRSSGGTDVAWWHGVAGLHGLDRPKGLILRGPSWHVDCSLSGHDNDHEDK